MMISTVGQTFERASSIGSTVTTLPNGAVDQNIKGQTYFVFGSAYYRPFYSGSSVIYEVVAKTRLSRRGVAWWASRSPEAMGKFALAYADQAEHDHAHCAPPSALAS
jgi:hypothetical protein